MLVTCAVLISLWTCFTRAHICDLRNDSEGLFADCSRRDLRDVPRDLPGDIVSLDAGYNHISSLKKSALSKYRNLTFLNIERSDIDNVDHDVFEGLMQLTTLKLAGNFFGIQTGLYILKTLTERNMSELDLSSVYPRNNNKDAFKQNIFVITKNDTRFLTDICISTVELQGNRLAFIENDALFGAPFVNCLEKLDLSYNSLERDKRLLIQLSKFTKLRYFSIGDQFCKMLPKKPTQVMLHAIHISLSLPSNLEYLDFSNIINTEMAGYEWELIFLNASKVNTFLFGYNSLYGSGDITFRGLDNVDTLDLSGNDARYINSFSFSVVTKLHVRNCNLRFVMETDLLFKDLKHLQYIDMSHNALIRFPTLPNPHFAETLNLSSNAFENIPFDVKAFSALKTLDMTFNSITHLDFKTRDKLDRVNNLSLSLSGNVFACGCENVDFILWLTNTNTIKELERNYPCIMDDGTVSDARKVAMDYVGISRHCIGKFLLTLTVVLVISLLTCFVIVYIVAKNPNRYWNILLRLFGFRIFMYTPKEFPYKFYISYCDTDIQFVYQTLRPALELCHNPVHLFLKDRDVLPGVDIADGIMVGIENSWKTILVVSQDFLNDPWSNFTINTAVYSMTDLIPDRIILLLVGGVEVKDLPEALLNAVDEDFIFNFDDFEKKQQTLWERFREMNHFY